MELYILDVRLGKKIRKKNVDGRQQHGPANAGLKNHTAALTYAEVGRSDQALWLTLNGLAGSC